MFTITKKKYFFFHLLVYHDELKENPTSTVGLIS